ncbi:MAG: acetamidase/formamidase family protein, partial [Streptosporangiaceae bacterium]
MSAGDLVVVGYSPEPAEYVWTFGGAPPIRRISPGTVLEVFTEDCFAGRVRSETDLVSEVCEFPFLNPQTGPFYVEGAEPGDTLAVHFVSITPARDWGVSTTVQLFGALTSTHLTATLQDPLPEVVWIWGLDRDKGICRFSARDSDFIADLPMNPMHGTIGVAPANLEVRSALVPDAFGGNMDTPEMCAGVTCYLGVNVPGALLSVGDGHARQGEGETCGVAVECAMDTVLIVDLLKGVATPWPRIESDTHIMSTGSARPLEDAFRIAQADIVGWVAAECGLSTMDAYQFVTQAVQAPLANVCDTNYTSVAKIRKDWLPSSATPMRGAHQQLREIARVYHGAGPRALSPGMPAAVGWPGGIALINNLRVPAGLGGLCSPR